MAKIEAIRWEYKTELFTAEDSLNVLGKKGWELVCPAGKDGNYLVFKRPLGAEVRQAKGASNDTASAEAKKKAYREFI